MALFKRNQVQAVHNDRGQAHQVAGQVRCYGLLDWEGCRYLTYRPCRMHRLILEQLSSHATSPTSDPATARHGQSCLPRLMLQCAGYHHLLGLLQSS